MHHSPLLWLIPCMPLAASVLTPILGPRLRGKSHWPCVIALGFAVFYSVILLGEVPRVEHGVVLNSGFEWGNSGGLVIRANLRADALTAVMLLTVTFVSLLVCIFSIGYMHHDPGYVRFFSIFALFVFCMTMLVLAGNFLLLYVFWEGVGLCSYLLIGFWYQKPSAAEAARKAFLVNRIGDFGFALGIFLIWTTFGTLEYDAVFASATSDTPWILTICLLLFVGAMGKSAQFPLHVWLPDAMEGPTPVSALIHAATMVTAGVYMVARCTPLFLHAEIAQLVVAVIGGFTALLAALIALTQTDLKRVMAYSTVSQLGYMFLGLGSAAAQPKLAMFAVTAAIFHLVTHAFFKALLFLASGSVMHGMGNVIDMRQFGGLRRVMPRTHIVFLCGALALAGFPIIGSGFWSKDEIFAAVSGGIHGPFQPVFLTLAFMGLGTAFLTAFYTFRAYFLTFWGEERFPPEAGEHPHESPRVMLVPLAVLAFFAIFIGLLLGPTHLFTHYLEQTHMPGVPEAIEPEGAGIMMLLSIVLALGGIGLACVMYLWRPSLATLAMERLPNLYRLSLNKFYLDEIYFQIVVAPAKALAAICGVGDLYIVDGVVDLIGWIPARLGAAFFRPVQNGLVQFYALAMLMGLVVFVVAIVSRLSG
jgi:NADH-quinone oxidoreductase subunit L